MTNDSDYTSRLIERAERDSDFRARLLSDPTSAISEELGVAVPEGMNVRVIEERADEVVLFIPAAAGSAEVRDEELAAVGGGSGNDWCDGLSALASASTGCHTNAC